MYFERECPVTSGTGFQWRRYAIAFVLILFSALASYGQNSTGQIIGRVTDSTGAVVPGAKITITNTATGVAREDVSRASGDFSVSQLAPGPYKVKVEAPGFSSQVVDIAALQVNQTIKQDVSLKVGNAADTTIEVSASEEVMQTSTADVGTVINGEEVHDVPLNGRNFTQLMTLAPGSTPISTGQSASIGFGPISSIGIPGSSMAQPSLQGQWTRMDFYTLDGAINVASISNSYVVLPTIDSIQEFKVQTHSDNSEFGSVLGGVVNVVTKGGTNDLHGTTWEYVRNNDFDAKNSFTGINNLHQNEFGATVGGPVYIPKLYHGKNRSFFYFGYEGWRYASANGDSYLTVPTDAELSGDFSNSVVTHVDPVSGNVVPNSIYDPTNAVRTQFSGNKIPTARIDPITQKFVQTYYDRPTPGLVVPGYPQDNDLVKGVLHNNNNSFNVRIDERLGAKDNLFFRYTRMNYTQNSPDSNSLTSQAIEHPVNYAAGWTHLFSPNLLADFSFGYSKLDYAQIDLPNANVPSIQTAGFTSLLDPGYPSFGLVGYSGMGGSDAPGYLNRYNKNFSASGNLSYTRGRHSIRGGFQFLMLGYANGVGVPASAGGGGNTVYGFAFNQTSDGTNNTTSGNGLASALLSYPYQVDTTVQHFNLKYQVYSGYIQDSWKPTPKLTVNMGLRLDTFGSPYLTDGGLQSEIDPNTGFWDIGTLAALPQCYPAASPCIPTGANYLAQTGTAGLGISAANHIAQVAESDIMPQSTNNFGPRLGIAYAVSPKLAVRAGFGMVYDTVSGVLQTVQSLVGGWPSNSDAHTVLNATPVPTTTLEMATQNTGIAVPGPTPFTSAGWMYDPKQKAPYSEQWNLELQQQITPTTSATLSYVGSEDHRLPVSGMWNVGTLGSLGADRPFPWYTTTFMQLGKGWSNFHALEAKAQGRFFHSLDLLGSFTYSKSLDVASGFFGVENGSGNGLGAQYFPDLRGEYGPSGFNLKFYTTITALYQLPFGKGQPFVNHGLAGYLLGNIQLNTTTSTRSGLPFSIQANGDIAQECPNAQCAFGVTSERANLIGNPKGPKTKSEWFNTAAFTTPALGTLGTSSRDLLTSQGVISSDCSLFKAFPITEKTKMQFRAEGFNVFNHVGLNVPDTNVNSASFGAINKQATSSRELQFGLRLEY